MRTIFRLVRWFGRALERDGIGWVGFWGAAFAGFVLGCMLGCMGRYEIRNQYETKLGNFRNEAVKRNEMEVWRTPDGENVYRWKDKQGE